MMELGEMEQFELLEVRLTTPLKLPMAFTLIVDVAGAPRFTVTVVGFADTPKLATFTVIGTV